MNVSDNKIRIFISDETMKTFIVILRNVRLWYKKNVLWILDYPNNMITLLFIRLYF